MEENKNTENTFESDSSKKKSESKKAMNGMQGGIVFAVISGLCAHFVYKFYE